VQDGSLLCMTGAKSRSLQWRLLVESNEPPYLLTRSARCRSNSLCQERSCARPAKGTLIDFRFPRMRVCGSRKFQLHAARQGRIAFNAFRLSLALDFQSVSPSLITLLTFSPSLPNSSVPPVPRFRDSRIRFKRLFKTRPASDVSIYLPLCGSPVALVFDPAGLLSPDLRTTHLRRLQTCQGIPW